MRTGNNAIEAAKASKDGDALRIREELPALIAGRQIHRPSCAGS